MAPTKAELLDFLRQASEDYPQLTKEELTALAFAHFSGGPQDVESPSEKSESQTGIIAGKTPIVSDQLIGEHSPKVQVTSLPAHGGKQPGKLHQDECVWPVMTRRVVLVILLFALCFSLVITGAYVFGLRTQPSKEQELISTDVLRITTPYETGEVDRFGKRLASNTAYYDDKYRNKVLEMVGLVEVVERNSEGYLEVTILLNDQRNAVYRASFRFLPEQKEAIALARGTMAVLKGKFTGYKDGMMRLFPAVVVYNNSQPEG